MRGMMQFSPGLFGISKDTQCKSGLLTLIDRTLESYGVALFRIKNMTSIAGLGAALIYIKRWS